MSLPPLPRRRVTDAVSVFGHALKPTLNGPGQREAQLCAPIETLVKTLGSHYGVGVVMHDETLLSNAHVRPDFAVDVDGVLIGYIEVKAPGKGADPTRWQNNSHPHDWEQWLKLSALPNVLYTDGNQWALYRYGQRVGDIASLVGDVRHAGSDLKPDANGRFDEVVRDFLGWQPVAPTTVDELVASVASVCRLLHDQVLVSLSDASSPLHSLHDDWKGLMFPKLSEETFASHYAQATTFALLSARAAGINFTGKDTGDIGRALSKTKPFLGRTLEMFTDSTAVVAAVGVSLGVLVRSISVVNWAELSSTVTPEEDQSSEDALLLRLYEDFFLRYDPSLRKGSGAFATPAPLASALIAMTDDVLRTRLNKPFGFADESITIVDPAAGTGTLPVQIIDRVAEQVRTADGKGVVPAELEGLAARLCGMEMQPGPYVVADMRMRAAFSRHGVTPSVAPRLRLADSLIDPSSEPELNSYWHEPIVRERMDAQRIRSDKGTAGNPVVVVSSPPHATDVTGQGGWIESGSNAAPNALTLDCPMDDFKQGASSDRVLTNKYVWFWRLATWMGFDNPDTGQAAAGGIVSLITTSGFLHGIGFAEMRRYLRERCDEVWVIDLGGHLLNTKGDENIYPTKTPMALTIGVRKPGVRGDTNRHAVVRYHALRGKRDDKLAFLESITDLSSVPWSQTTGTDGDPLVPADDLWENIPLLNDLFPFSATGIDSSRSYVYAPEKTTLNRRWERLTSEPDPSKKAELFKESGVRTLGSVVSPLPGYDHNVPIGQETASEPVGLRPVALRAFDVQYTYADTRMHDVPRRSLWATESDRQIFISEHHNHAPVSGPAVAFSAVVPNKHFYKGNGGGRVMPLYLDAEGSQPNVTPGLLKMLSDLLNTSVTVEDLLAYVAATTAHPGYVDKFGVELAQRPGTRVVLTRDPALWDRAVSLGRSILWLHTLGERFVAPDEGRPSSDNLRIVPGRPQVDVPIPNTPESMPDSHRYDDETETLHVGEGQIRGVSRAVVDYEVSKMNVLSKWFKYRKKNPATKWVSELNDIVATTWTPQTTRALLDLLHVLTLTVDAERDQRDLLEEILSNDRVDVRALHDACVFPVPESSRKHEEDGDDLPSEPAPSDQLTIF